jgi:carboxyl-terminal processing protease
MDARSTICLLAALLIAGCGGDGGSSGSSGSGAGSSVAPPAPQGPSAAGCSLGARQQWADAAIREWYLFPETLPAAAPIGSTSLTAFIDALTATARAQGRDRFFTYVTSIAEEEAFFRSGSSAGLGIRLQTDAASRRAFIAESFETGPAFQAGVDRGDEILAVGTTAAALRTTADIIAAEGTGGVSAALGPNEAGIARSLRLRRPDGSERTVTLVKRAYDLEPLSPRYGARILADNGRQVGYLNLRSFITSAEAPLRAAFDRFRAAGVTDLVIDFRYNGGGLVSTAELMGDLLGRNRFASDVFGETVHRPEKAALNRIRRFNPRSESVAPARIAFITTAASASGSEVVINAMLPYLRGEMALIGANSFGKPVGQIAEDRSACDDRLRIVAFSTRNAAGSDDYFDGLARTVAASCAAPDEVGRPLGDAREASIAQALDFLAGRGTCTPIATGQRGQALAAGRPSLLTPAQPSVAQREVPGLH